MTWRRDEKREEKVGDMKRKDQTRDDKRYAIDTTILGSGNGFEEKGGARKGPQFEDNTGPGRRKKKGASRCAESGQGKMTSALLYKKPSSPEG